MMDKAILVYVGADCLGDAIQKIPYINALRKSFPAHKIVWFANGGSVFTGLLKEISAELLDDVICNINFSANTLDLFRNPFVGTPLAGFEFDYIFDTQKRWKQTLIVKKIKHKQFISGCADFLFSDMKPKRGYHPARNVTKRLIEMVSMVTGQTHELDYSVFIPPRFIEEAQKILPPGCDYLGFIPCGSTNQKKWPLKNYIELAHYYRAGGYIPVFILGPEERCDEAQILEALPDAIIPDMMTVNADNNLHGPLYYMALGKQLTAIVSNDCGPGHLLNCAHRPMIFLFGPTDAEKFAPERDGVTILKASDFSSQLLSDVPVAAVKHILNEMLCNIVELKSGG